MIKRIQIFFVTIGLLLGAFHAPADDGETFYAGVYIYDYQVKAAAENLGEGYFPFLEKHLQILQAHGVNVVHLAISYPDEFEEHLRLFDKYGMKLLPQIDFAYFNPPESDEAQAIRAQGAAAFINKHVNDPRVLAWSVKEEVSQKDVTRLATFYTQILADAPEAKFFTLHNALGAAKDQPVPHPVISGTDRYAFWWEFSGGGYLASPAFALDWTRTQAATYYEESARRGADFMLVVTQGGMLMPKWANTLIKTPREIAYPTVVDEQLAMQEKVLTFAEEGRMGWRKVSTESGDFYNVWKYYRAPENAMKALAWTAVLEGGRYFLVWHYEPYGKTERQPDFEAAAASGAHEIQYITLAGRPGMANPQLTELGDAIGEIRQYERIITQMTKLPTASLTTEAKHVHCKAFSFPGLSGEIVVVHNANIGTWPGESRRMFKDDDPIKIDDEGNLVGYTSFTEAMDAKLLRTDEDGENGVYDLKTGKEIVAKEGYHVDVLPGSGRLLYVGTLDEAKKLSALVK